MSRKCNFESINFVVIFLLNFLLIMLAIFATTSFSNLLVLIFNFERNIISNLFDVFVFIFIVKELFILNQILVYEFSLYNNKFIISFFNFKKELSLEKRWSDSDYQVKKILNRVYFIKIIIENKNIYHLFIPSVNDVKEIDEILNKKLKVEKI